MYDKSVISTASFGVAERRTAVEDSGRSGRTYPSAARVAVAGGMEAREATIAFKLVGVVYGVTKFPLYKSEALEES
jgi:hypothetical protein